MPHALVVGGTGMLKKASLWLVEQGYHVSVIARDDKKLSSLVENSKDPSHITPLKVDYENEISLRLQIHKSIQKNGPIDLVVTWIHSTAPNALPVIMNQIEQSILGKWKLYHVCGSSSNLEELKTKADPSESCLYHQVKLGFVIESNKSRWLTNDEIADGVIEAIKNENDVTVVGTLTPWEKRPGY
jgi:hypothetical protein